MFIVDSLYYMLYHMLQLWLGMVSLCSTCGTRLYQALSVLRLGGQVYISDCIVDILVHVGHVIKRFHYAVSAFGVIIMFVSGCLR